MVWEGKGRGKRSTSKSSLITTLQGGLAAWRTPGTPECRTLILESGLLRQSIPGLHAVSQFRCCITLCQLFLESCYSSELLNVTVRIGKNNNPVATPLSSAPSKLYGLNVCRQRRDRAIPEQAIKLLPTGADAPAKA